jgi:NADPH2:quinone reductase
MRAIMITSYEGPDAVEARDVEEPQPASGQVLIDVKAAGVSFPELLQTRGRYQLKPPVPYIPGSEVAGIVAAAPADSAFAVGDRVAAFSMIGGYAERIAVNESSVFPLSGDLTFAEGAALPLNYLTAHFALLHRAHLISGETVLVHGAAGGVGTAAIQVAKAFGAATVIAVVSSEEKRGVALAVGADEVIMVDGFRDAVATLTDGRGVDVVVDPVGGDRFTDSLRSLATDGRLLVIGFTAGDIPTVQVNRLLLNNISVVGVAWGGYALSHPDFAAEQWSALASHISSGALRPPIGASFPLERAAEALATLDERRATGKVVLEGI